VRSFHADSRLRIKVSADEDSSFIIMFEPSGMTYELNESEYMFAEVPAMQFNDMEIAYWNGGISIWAPGSVITFDANGQELHRLN
jgi:hypothetical protein